MSTSHAQGVIGAPPSSLGSETTSTFTEHLPNWAAIMAETKIESARRAEFGRVVHWVFHRLSIFFIVSHMYPQVCPWQCLVFKHACECCGALIATHFLGQSWSWGCHVAKPSWSKYLNHLPCKNPWNSWCKTMGALHMFLMVNLWWSERRGRVWRYMWKLPTIQWNPRSRRYCIPTVFGDSLCQFLASVWLPTQTTQSINRSTNQSNCASVVDCKPAFSTTSTTQMDFEVHTQTGVCTSVAPS